MLVSPALLYFELPFPSDIYGPNSSTLSTMSREGHSQGPESLMQIRPLMLELQVSPEFVGLQDIQG